MTSSRKRMVLTAALAVGAVAAAGSGAMGNAQHPEPTAAPQSVKRAPALVALVTPNNLYAAAGAPPVVIVGPHGSVAVRSPATGSAGVPAVRRTSGGRSPA